MVSLTFGRITLGVISQASKTLKKMLNKACAKMMVTSSSTTRKSIKVNVHPFQQEDGCLKLNRVKDSFTKMVI